MDLFVAFVGRAEPLAELYEGVRAMSFMVRDLQVEGFGLVIPIPGDVVRVRMQPDSDIRNFRCVGRHFDFSGEGASNLLTIELDMPVVDPHAL